MGATAGTSAGIAVSSEARVLLLERGGEATFGRDPRAGLRIGAAPVHDPGVPRLAGRVVVDDDGAAVENLDDERPFIVVADDGRALPVRPRSRLRSRGRHWTILVRGELTVHRVEVTAASGGLELSDEQRRLLDAYAAPVHDGGLVATHEQVAGELGLTPSAVRTECQRIRAELVLAGVEVRGLADVREEIVDAWLRR